MTIPNKQIKRMFRNITPLLVKVYGEATAENLVKRLYEQFQEHLTENRGENLDKWDQNKVILITYGDSILGSAEEKPLVTLERFLSKYLSETITGVHILPFFPYSSDDGFAVIDYLQVNPELGDWKDIEAIAKKFNLMADLVINHISSKSLWLEQYKKQEKPGTDYFIEVDPNTDLSQVVRPRSSSLLAEIDTVEGKKHLWATFSHDQIDLNFANPDVLIEFIKIILFYVQKGAKYVRLDAVGFLWKEIGTSCIHLPQTHAIVRIIREILQMVDRDIALITETNVPNKENLSYFGNRDEAHMIYNFSLPPLLVNALIQGKSEHLKTWMMSMPPAPMGCAYFNFTASHDGIGVRPAEGLLGEKEYHQLLETMEKFGGRISMRSKADGTKSPYEINISLFDALKGTVKGEDQWHIERFICSQTIMISLEGIPGFYIHSLLATPNHDEGVTETGINRTINRYRWNYQELEQRLADPDTPQAKILKELCRRIQIRRRQSAFHPYATQYTLHPLNSSLFAFWRQSRDRDQSIFCIFNLSDRIQELQLSSLNLVSIDVWCDLISGQCFNNIYDTLLLEPYQCLWITNQFSEPIWDIVE